MVSIDGVTSKTSLKFRWINQNPFRSIYFAALHMAAELSTGIHLFQYTGQYKFSMLLVATSAEFYKKATGKIHFVCNDGELANEKVLAAITHNDPQTMTFTSDAINEEGELVAQLKYNWSIKSKARKGSGLKLRFG